MKRSKRVALANFEKQPNDHESYLYFASERVIVVKVDRVRCLSLEEWPESVSEAIRVGVSHQASYPPGAPNRATSLLIFVTDRQALVGHGD